MKSCSLVLKLRHIIDIDYEMEMYIKITLECCVSFGLKFCWEVARRNHRPDTVPYITALDRAHWFSRAHNLQHFQAERQIIESTS